MSISSLLNPVTRNEDRSQNGDDGRTINWRNINANFRHPHRKPKARMIPVVDSTPFEIPTVSMKFLSRLSCEEPELSRYPLIAAYISCKLVSLVKFQRPLSRRPLVLQEIYRRIYYVLCDIGCSSKLALSSVLYMLWIFPDGIPYYGIRDHHCVHLVVRLFLLGFQLGIAWFHDDCCTSKTWSKLMGLTKKNVIRLEQAALQILGYTLFISPSAWNGFMEQIHEDCPLFLYPGDFENLRQLVRSSHVPVYIAGPEQGPCQLAAIGTISQAEIEYHRLRISECAIRGKITVSPNQDTESSRIEAGTEEDYLFDVFDAAEELLFEELVESDQLLPLSPRFLPSTSTNAVSKQSSTSVLPPQSYPSSSTRSSPPAPGTCLSPVIKIEEVEVELVWPSSPHNAVSVRDQRSEHPARRESLRELPYDDSDCEVEDDMTKPDELYRSYTGAHLDVQIGHSESQVRVPVRFRTPEEGTQIEEEEEGEEEVDYCDCSEYEDDGPHLSQLFSLSSLSPLSTTYNSDVEIDDAEEIDEEERDSEDNCEHDSDFDSNCSYASSTSATSAFDPSVSPPPFKIPDTYDRETGLWTIPSPKSTEEELGNSESRHIRQEEERPFDFTSTASTPDIKDEFYSMSHYGPISLGQGGFADGERAPSPHPLDLEAELIHREFLSFPPRDRLSSPAVVRINSMVQGALA
ncbi:uncharacterized protein C8R40DRAFT_1133962 [Lentinula edodes]|uniref:uncharacterized protein n=1 Tax=Lentinula edodes TaxID=5353 RepID=UPI001E8DA27B|nr:uncharacterized protein C8R40DRAFT_1133962 [Lentinula edodes]KAH7868595.1 hypothetical protein C8R40DRAFT_1133962 [Lentinula edodes]